MCTAKVQLYVPCSNGPCTNGSIMTIIPPVPPLLTSSTTSVVPGSTVAPQGLYGSTAGGSVEAAVIVLPVVVVVMVGISVGAGVLIVCRWRRIGHKALQETDGATPPHSTTPNDGATPPHSSTPNDVATPPHSTIPNDGAIPPHCTRSCNNGATPPNIATPNDGATPPNIVTPNDGATPPNIVTPNDGATPPNQTTPCNNGVTDTGLCRSLRIFVAYSSSSLPEERKVILHYLVHLLESKHQVKVCWHEIIMTQRRGFFPYMLEHEIHLSSLVLCVCNKAFYDEWTGSIPPPQASSVTYIKSLLAADLQLGVDISLRYAVVLLKKRDVQFIPTDYMNRCTQFNVTDIESIAHFIEDMNDLSNYRNPPTHKIESYVHLVVR